MVSRLSFSPLRALIRLLLVTAAARGAIAQVPPSTQDSGFGTIRGAAYDSLLGGPLAGARVELLGGSRSTQTDRRGRYVLDSVPAGRQVVTFWHPALDSIGLSSFAATVLVRAREVETVPLAVPSHATFWRAACGAPHRFWSDSGIVFGTIRDAEAGERLPGARAAISWLEVKWDSAGHGSPVRAGAEVWTDSLGTYYLCGAPVEYLVTAEARAGPFKSGVVDVLVDPRGIVRRDLTVSLEVVARDSAAPPTGRGLATVIGTVRGERGGILPGAIATLDDGDDTATVDAAGRFVLRDVPSGSRMLMVRRVGYFAWRSQVDLRNRDTTRVNAALEEATMLDTIRVTAAPQLAALLEEIQMRRLAGFGYMFGMSEIRRRPYISSVFQGLPSIQVMGPLNRFTLWGRATYSLLSGPQLAGGYCRMAVFIDGFRSDEEALASLLPSQVVLIEVYPRPGAFLGRYTDSLSPCGVVLVWTAFAR